MRYRFLAGGAAVWALAFGVGYVALIRAQDSTVAWWYVALIVTGAAALGGFAVGRWGRRALVLGLVVLAVCTLLGLASIGMFLLPAVVAAAVAVALRPAGAVS